jgi:hypothetical protein
VQWSVHALNAAVETEIEALPVGLRARLTRLVEMIATLGLERVHEPHVKHIDGKLWEMRVKSADPRKALPEVFTSPRAAVAWSSFMSS